MTTLIALIAFLLPFERLGAITLGGVNVRPSQIVLLAALAFAARTAVHGRLSGRVPRALVPLAAFFAVASLSIINAEHLPRSLTVLCFTIFTASLAWLLPAISAHLSRSRQMSAAVFCGRVRGWLLSGAAIVAVFGLWQFFGDMLGAPAWATGLRSTYSKAILGFTRVQGASLEPLYFANYLLLPAGLAVAWLAEGPPRRIARWLYALLAVIFIDVLLTASRGGYAGFAAMLVALAWTLRGRIVALRRLVAVGALGVAAFIVGFFALGRFDATVGSVTERFASHVSTLRGGAAYDERLTTVRGALEAWQRHPWLGVGIGGYGPFVAPFAHIKPEAGWPIVNNEPFELLAETGLLGLAAFLSFVIVLLHDGARRSSPDLEPFRIGALAAVVGMLVQYQTFSTLYIMHVWFAVGLLLAASRPQDTH